MPSAVTHTPNPGRAVRWGTRDDDRWADWGKRKGRNGRNRFVAAFKVSQFRIAKCRAVGGTNLSIQAGIVTSDSSRIFRDYNSMSSLFGVLVKPVPLMMVNPVIVFWWGSCCLIFLVHSAMPLNALHLWSMNDCRGSALVSSFRVTRGCSGGLLAGR